MSDDATSAARIAKASLRGDVRRRILAMPAAVRDDADRRISQRLAAFADETGAAFVIGYVALPDEAKIEGFLSSALGSGRTVLLPRAEGGALCFGRWKPLVPLSPDEEGVLAPAADWVGALPRETGVIAVPGRAFDRSGRRLGRGGGYYDRFLSKVARAHLVVGAAYSCQVVDDVPSEAHDRTVPRIVTEEGWIDVAS